MPELFFQVSQRKDFTMYAQSIWVAFKRSYVFKFGGSGKIRRIWKRPLIQVSIVGYNGFLRETFGLFIDKSDKAEVSVSSTKSPLSELRP